MAHAENTGCAQAGCVPGAPSVNPPRRTPEAIRALDGPALAALAERLWLLPCGVQWREGWAPNLWEGKREWRPWEDRRQAQDVLALLRTHRWDTHHHHSLQGQSFVAVMREEDGQHPSTQRIDVEYGSESQCSEAHALLLVSVLALASQQEEA